MFITAYCSSRWALAQRKFAGLKPGDYVRIAALAVLAAGCSTAPVLTDRDTILIADFSNATGVKAWDGTLRPVVTVLLQQSPFFTIVSDQRVQRTMRGLQQPAEQPVTGESGRTVCTRLGGKAIVEGDLAGTDNDLTLTLTVAECSSGKTLAHEAIKGNKTTIVGALTAGVRTLRKALGEPAATLDKYNADAVTATSGSIEALRAYGEGIRMRAVRNDEASIPYFQDATTKDPAFVNAYSKLGVVAFNTGRLQEARGLAARAHELRDKATQYERLYIDWNYASRVELDPKSIKTSLDKLTAEYPRDFAARNNFGVFYNGTGEYEEALKQYQAASDLAPDEPGPISNAAYVLLTLGRYDDASLMIDRALAIRPDPSLALARWITARIAGLPRASEFETVARKMASPEQMATIDASLAAWSGRFKAFDTMQREFIARAKASANPDAAQAAGVGRLITVAVYRGGRDLDELRATAAREKNPALLAQELSALTVVGDIAAVRSGLAKLPEAAKTDSSLTMALAVPRAFVLASDGHPAEAAGALQNLLSMSTRLRELNYFIGSFKEQAGDLDGAIASYRMCTEAVTFIGTNPIIPISRMRLAKALIKKGDSAGAKQQLDALLAQWKDADTDFPALVEARKLRSQ